MGKVHIPEVLPPEPPEQRALVTRSTVQQPTQAELLKARRRNRREAMEQIQFATDALREIINLFSEPKSKAKRKARRGGR